VVDSEGTGRRDPRLFDAVLDFILDALVGGQRDVTERRRGKFRTEMPLIVGVSELEERQCTTVLQAEEAMAVLQCFAL
jgi:hypothetical protein